VTTSFVFQPAARTCDGHSRSILANLKPKYFLPNAEATALAISQSALAANPIQKAGCLCRSADLFHNLTREVQKVVSSVAAPGIAPTDRLAGRVALVTGAGSGIGAAIAQRLASEGAIVIATDRDQAAARRVAGGIGALAVRLDVTAEEEWRAAIGFAEAERGGIHILVNNAGICEPGTVEDINFSNWRRSHRVNLDSVFLGCKHAIPLMARTAARTGLRGSIVNIASISALVAGSNLAAYNSSKAAVRHFTRSVALHCAKQQHAITANAVLPTFVDTPLIDGLLPGRDRGDALSKLASQVPLGRVGRPEEVAGAVAFLCSDDAAFMTGTDLILDGGLSAQ
jgi:NAD(P)-dependent dehydrogenase (short-subunit alcohol dehydrogenase family)